MNESSTREHPVKHQHPFDWQPVPYSTIINEELANEIYTNGYAVIDLLSEEQVEALRAVYAKYHKLDDDRGGMFYGVYSQDIDYRRNTDKEIGEVLSNSMPDWFHEFENVVNFFITKLPGPQSEFAIHQDMTAVDEFKYSPLSLWIPLQDTGVENGTMCVVPKTHWLFSPYRGISWPFPFANIKETVRKYMQPIEFRAGQALLFDPRLLHTSLANNSGSERVAIVSGVFPNGFQFINCYREPQPGAKTELFLQDKEWVLTYPNFLENCHIRPTVGEVIGEARFEFPEISAGEFEAFCHSNGVDAVGVIGVEPDVNCNMIGEPK